MHHINRSQSGTFGQVQSDDRDCRHTRLFSYFDRIPEYLHPLYICRFMRIAGKVFIGGIFPEIQAIPDSFICIQCCPVIWPDKPRHYWLVHSDVRLLLCRSVPLKVIRDDVNYE